MVAQHRLGAHPHRAGQSPQTFVRRETRLRLPRDKNCTLMPPYLDFTDLTFYRIIYYTFTLTMNPRLTLTFLLSCAALTSATAATTALGTSLDDALNYGTFSSSVMQSVTLNGVTYTTDQLTQIELTAFKGASGSVLLQQNGATNSPNAQQRLDFLETDWRGDTGIINPSNDSDSVAANFVTPVVNIVGPDMFVYEIAGDPNNPDAFQIRINGTQLTVGRGSYGDSGADTFNEDVLTLSSTPSSLSQLLNLTPSSGATDITQSIVGVAIDFSDFGVALGETVSSFTFDSSTVNSSSTFDPVLIAAVPEPQSYALFAGMLSLAWLAIRRRG